MRKNKKLWSYALAGALAVSNLSAVAMPFASIVAQAEEAVSPVTVKNNGNDVSEAAAGDELTIDAAEITTNKKIWVTSDGKTWEEISVDSGAYKYTVTGYETDLRFSASDTADATEPDNKYVKAIRVAVLNNIQVNVTNEVQNIPNKTAAGKSFLKGNGKDGVVVASVKITDEDNNDKTEFKKGNVKYLIKKGSDDVTDEFEFNDGTAPSTTITDKNAGAGDYSLYAFIDEDTNGKWGTNELISDPYAFSVVKCATTLSVMDEKGDSTATLNTGESTSGLTLYADGELVNGVNWSAGKTDNPVMTVDASTGKATALEVNADASDKVVAKVTVADDDLYYEYEGYDVTINKYVAPTYAVVVDAPKTGLELGQTAQAKLMLDDEEIESGVTWSISPLNAASIDSTGLITAKSVSANTEVKVTATYKDTTGNEDSKTATFNVNALSYVYALDGEEVENKKADIREGTSKKITVAKSTGGAVEGVTWKSSNTNVATVDSEGVITVKEGTANTTTRISSYLNGTEQFGDTITITSKPYVKVYEITPTANELFYGESAEFTATYEDEDGNEVDVTNEGTWKATSADVRPEGAFKLTKNKLEVTAPITTAGTVTVSFWDKKSDTTGAADKTTTIEIKEDSFLLQVDGKEVGTWTEGTKILAYSLPNMEVGETRSLAVFYGSTEVTNNMSWTGNDYISYDAGAITAVKAGATQKVTGTYKVDGADACTVEITVKQIFPETNAEEKAKEASDKAGEASTAAGEASTAAGVAEDLAAAAIEDPTEENLKKAQDALDEANKNLETAQKAYDEAEAAYNEAEAAGAKSTEAKKAVDDAKAALEVAEKAVEDAGKAVANAETAVSEATEVVTDKVKEDAIEAANAAADKAVKDPTDANIQAAKDAVKTAESKGVEAADLKSANDKIAQAEAANEAAKKAEEEAKKKAEEEAQAADGSAKDTPAAAGTELVDANGNKTGFKVTDANASAPEVEYEAPADKNATKVDIPETYTDLSGNVYKVVGIDARAFKDTKVKTVTIRKNIKRIDPKAFYKSKVKNVKIKGTKLTKKMAKSFKKLKKGGKITCSGSHKKKNKEILNNLSTVKNGKTKVK